MNNQQEKKKLSLSKTTLRRLNHSPLSELGVLGFPIPTSCTSSGGYLDPFLPCGR